MASSVAGCLRSVGYDMPCVSDVMPLLDVDKQCAGFDCAVAGRGQCCSVFSS